MAGDDEFGGGDGQVRRGNPAIWRQLRAIPVNSLGGEEEGGAVDFLSTSAGLGEARNGDSRWQPWRWSSVTGKRFTGERENRGGKRKGGQGRDKEEGEASRAAPRVLLVVQSGKQEVARSTSREPPRRCLPP
jgi:hypothetical protein